MTPLALQFALHGSIKRKHGEVAWRVVHAGGVSAGVMLLAVAMPSQWVAMNAATSATMAIGLIVGTYLLCLGMYVAAIWDTRGIPGGGTALNRLVAGLYSIGTIMTLLGGALLVFGLLRTALIT